VGFGDRREHSTVEDESAFRTATNSLVEDHHCFYRNVSRDHSKASDFMLEVAISLGCMEFTAPGSWLSEARTAIEGFLAHLKVILPITVFDDNQCDFLRPGVDQYSQSFRWLREETNIRLCSISRCV
jgi:hypothetical protein